MTLISYYKVKIKQNINLYFSSKKLIDTKTNSDLTHLTH